MNNISDLKKELAELKIQKKELGDELAQVEVFIKRQAVISRVKDIVLILTEDDTTKLLAPLAEKNKMPKAPKEPKAPKHPKDTTQVGFPDKKKGKK
jgi:hypothetical protein